MQRALFLLLLFLLSAVLGGQATTLNDKIVFEINRDGNDEIYVMDAHGGNLRNLTQHPGLDSYPDWSPGGKQVRFLSNRDDGINTYIMDADGRV